MAFVHGLLPYRDFLFLQPPGVVLLLSPFAALGTLIGDGQAMAVARVAFMLLGAANAVLVALVAGRHDRAAGLVAGGLYACWRAVAPFEETTLLVVPQAALLLLALLAIDVGSVEVRPGRRLLGLLAAGALLGLAMMIQLWAAVPIAIVAAWLLLASPGGPAARIRATIEFGAGAVAVVGLIFLPFVAASGPELLRYTVVDQVSRPDLGVGLTERIRLIEGLGRRGSRVVGALGEIGAVVAFVAITVTAWRLPRVRLWLALLVGQGIVLLSGPVFFPHYAAWLAPTAALALGQTAVTVGRRLRRWRPGRALTTGLAMVATVVLVASNVHRAGDALPLAALERELMGARCIAADEAILLIQTSALERDIANHCAVVIDPTGVSYDTDRGRLPSGDVGASRSRAPGYQAAMLDYYGTADAAVFARLYSDGLTRATWASLECRMARHATLGRLTILARDPSHPPQGCG